MASGSAAARVWWRLACSHLMSRTARALSNSLTGHPAAPCGAACADGELDASIFVIHPEIEAALRSPNGPPVVALESTIITHGMPYPDNVQTALEVEEVVRQNGALPATIAILAGKICVGLDKEQLTQLARAGHTALKVSRRDLAHAVASGATGGTTVSGTMIIAHKVGIRVFVTGGIGGVHRGGETTMDVSADLTELGRTPVAVVCAGAKSLLDIGRTLEYLETQGVTVAGFCCDEFPAFFVPSSGYPVSCRVNSAAECAQLVDKNTRLGLGSGLVVAVPVPSEHAAWGVAAAIDQAVNEANAQNVVGKDVTPFLLQRVNELTQGKSLSTNIALIKNNAAVGAALAAALQKLTPPSPWAELDATAGTHARTTTAGAATRASPRPVVLGAMAIDVIGTPRPSTVRSKKSTPGQVGMSFGGVGRNISESLARCGFPPQLISAVGTDLPGDLLLRQCAELAMDTSLVVRSPTHRTALLCTTLDSGGSLHVAVTDFDIIEAVLTPSYISSIATAISSAPYAVLDANAPAAAMRVFCELAYRAHVPVLYETTTEAKAARIIEAGVLGLVACVKTNLLELCTVCSALRNSAVASPQKLADTQPLVRMVLAAGVRHVVVTNGPEGVLLASSREDGDCHFQKFDALPVKIVNTNGAGDTFTGGLVAGLMAAQVSLVSPHAVYVHAVRGALAAAKLTCESALAVSPLITPATILGARN